MPRVLLPALKGFEGRMAVIVSTSIPGTFPHCIVSRLVFVTGSLLGIRVSDAGLLPVYCHGTTLASRWRWDQFRSHNLELSRNSGSSWND
jgi:hypothetical protein